MKLNFTYNQATYYAIFSAHIYFLLLINNKFFKMLQSKVLTLWSVVVTMCTIYCNNKRPCITLYVHVLMIIFHKT